MNDITIAEYHIKEINRLMFDHSRRMVTKNIRGVLISILIDYSGKEIKTLVTFMLTLNHSYEVLVNDLPSYPVWLRSILKSFIGCHRHWQQLKLISAHEKRCHQLIKYLRTRLVYND